MIKTKVAFLEGRLLSGQSEQSESKSSDWLEKGRPSKRATFFWSCKQAICAWLTVASRSTNQLSRWPYKTTTIILAVSSSDGSWKVLDENVWIFNSLFQGYSN